MHAVTARADAIKFADSSPIQVSCRLERAAPESTHCKSGDAGCSSSGNGDDAERHELTITVQDGGRGMAADEAERAFDAYFRAPSHRGGGTGLGALCSCNARACVHACVLRVASRACVRSPQGCTSASVSWKVCFVFALRVCA